MKRRRLPEPNHRKNGAHQTRTGLTRLTLLMALGGMGACSQSSGGEGVGVPSLLFIRRQTTTVAADGTVAVDVSGGNGQVLDYERYVPGGSLNLLSPARADGTRHEPHAAISRRPTSTAPTSRSTRKQAVFSMKRDRNDHYHIYTVQLSPGADGKLRDPPEDGGRPGRHQPDLPAGRSHRVRDERDVHGDGHARRRVRARRAGTAARDDLGRRRRRRPPSLRAEPLAYGRAVPPLTTARSASRAGSTSAASTT